MTLQSNKGLPISPGARLLGDLSRDPEIPWLPSSHFLLRPTALSTEKPPLCGPQTEKTPMPGEGGDNLLAVGAPMQKRFGKSHSKWKMVVRCFKCRATNVDFRGGQWGAPEGYIETGGQ